MDTLGGSTRRPCGPKASLLPISFQSAQESVRPAVLQIHLPAQRVSSLMTPFVSSANPFKARSDPCDGPQRLVGCRAGRQGIEPNYPSRRPPPHTHDTSHSRRRRAGRYQPTSKGMISPHTFCRRLRRRVKRLARLPARAYRLFWV